MCYYPDCSTPTGREPYCAAHASVMYHRTKVREEIPKDRAWKRHKLSRGVLLDDIPLDGTDGEA